MDTNDLKIDRLCRACNGEFDEMKSIFDKVKDCDKRLADMLMACASVHISEDDGLPTTICKKCTVKLKNAYNFKNQCEKTDENLRQTFEVNVIKEEIVVDGNTTDDYENQDSPKLDADDIQVKNEESSNESEPDDSNTTSAYNCKICFKEYTCLSNLNRHIRVHFPTKKTYTCKICFKSLTRKEHMKRHIIGNHVKIKPYLCDICKRGFVNEYSLYNHTKQCKGQKPFVCTICSQGFMREDSLQVHLNMHDTNILQKNPVLDSVDNLESYIQVEETDDKSEEMLKFLVNESDINHDLIVENQNGKTKTTKKVMMTKPRKRSWKQKRMTNDAFACRICDGTFLGPFIFKQHMLNEHNENNPFTCDYCKKSFPRYDHYLRHVNSHIKGKQFACDECPRKFSCESLLLKHKNAKHTVKETKYPCSLCKKLFSSEKNRDFHLKHFCLKDQSQRCKRCEKEFSSKYELNRHLRLANECSKRFLCSECGQRFTKKEYLITHMRRHTGERPFKCNYCDKAFPRTSDLKSHEKSHTGEKNHFCIICGKGFARAYMLTVHMRTHPGKRPYVCEYCQAAFVYNGALKAHIRESHQLPSSK